jgi:dUTP pyrophosphatase
MTLTLKWQRIGAHTLPLPSRAHPEDAGIDLPVIVDGETFAGHVAAPGHRVAATPEALIVFRTGWAVEIPDGWCGLIVVRSSVGKAGWDIESSGVIDAGYAGEILLPMCFRGPSLDSKRYVEHGQRMVQMLILPVPAVESIEVAALSNSRRGQGGFGSTGT